jgi:hypothetical protein
MPEGAAKVEQVSKLRRLNDRKDNLEDRLRKSGNAALLDTQLEAGLLDAQITLIDTYVADVTAHKATL